MLLHEINILILANVEKLKQVCWKWHSLKQLLAIVLLFAFSNFVFIQQLYALPFTDKQSAASGQVDVPVKQSIYTQQCSLKLNEISADAFSRAKIFGQITQNNLEIIYRDNKDYRTDYSQPGNMLADGKFGDITKRWLVFFCQEFSLNTNIASNEFVEQLLAALMTIAQLNNTYVNWRRTLDTKQLINWAYNSDNTEGRVITCNSRPGCFGSPVQLQQLLDKYYLQAGVEKARIGESPSHYRLSSEDISYFSSVNETLVLLEALVEQEFADKIALNNELRPLLKELTDEYQYYVLKLVEQSKPVVAETRESTPSTPSTKTPAVAAEDNRKDVNAEVTYKITLNGLEKMYQQLGLASLSEQQIISMQQVENTVFAQQYLLYVALRQAGIIQLSALAKTLITQRALKQGQGAMNKAPALIWQATTGCGCADNLTDTGEQKHSYYGLYPYWLDDKWFNNKQNQTIDFSQLTRIGYFSATVSEDSLGVNHLETPYNWQAKKPYTEFIDLAHKHRVNVDLVISNRRAQLNNTEHAVNDNYGQPLILDIVNTVKTPLREHIIDRLKPIISFGFSPSRTMADGVTLNFDLQQMTSLEQQDKFVRFIQDLKQGLSPVQKYPDELPLAALTDAYYLNMMVPVEQLHKNEGFYSLANLLKIAPQVNAFIMVFEAKTTTTNSTSTTSTEMTTQTSETAVPKSAIKQDDEVKTNVNTDRVRQMKDLRTLLGTKQHIANAEQLFNKIIPMLVTNDVASAPLLLESELNYTSWSYLGAAYWTLPLSDDAYEKINNTYFPSLENRITVDQNIIISDLTTKAVTTAIQLCNYLCPQRWLLRLVLFALFTLVICCAVVSIWIYQLRAMFDSWYFWVFSVIAAIFILLVFSCDPYWKRHQLVMFFRFTIINIAAGLMYRLRKSKDSKIN